MQAPYSTKNHNHKLVPIAQILVEDRMRVEMGEVQELAESIQNNGLFHPPVVETWNTGHIDGIASPYRYRLLAGGRRMAALTLLSSNKVEGVDGTTFDEIPVTIFNDLTPDQQIVVELEENIQRKAMTWVETLSGIVKYHKAKKRMALIAGDTWSQSMTGKLLNMNQAKISIAFKVWDYIQAKDEKILKAESLNEAIKIILDAELDAGQAEQMRRIQLKRAEIAAKSVALPNVNSAGSLTGGATVSTNVVGNKANVGPELPAVAKQCQFTSDQIAAFYHQGDALSVLPLLAQAGPINHIITDPPYGIDMAFLTGDTIERIAETHDVKQNLELIPAFLETAFNCIADDGFLAMWYDLDHHEKIAEWAKKIGWRAQRWPLHWCKTTPCSNTQAQYNFTKTVETCYIFRRSEKSVLKTKRSNNFHVGPNPRNTTHPFTKPDDVWGILIDTLTSENQVVVDPFAGEGSCLAALFKRKRLPVGIEIDPKHIASGVNFIREQLIVRDILEDFISPPL